MKTVNYQGRDYWISDNLYKMVENEEITVLEAIDLMEDTL